MNLSDSAIKGTSRALLFMLKQKIKELRLLTKAWECTSLKKKCTPMIWCSKKHPLEVALVNTKLKRSPRVNNQFPSMSVNKTTSWLAWSTKKTDGNTSTSSKKEEGFVQLLKCSLNFLNGDLESSGISENSTLLMEKDRTTKKLSTQCQDLWSNNLPWR